MDDIRETRRRYRRTLSWIEKALAENERVHTEEEREQAIARAQRDYEELVGRPRPRQNELNLAA